MSEVVYRLIGPCETLLYVGVTKDIPERIRRHRSQSVFGHLIETWTTDVYPSRSAALAAETDAIRSESPIFNARQAEDAPPFILDGIGLLVWSRLRGLGVGLREASERTGLSGKRLRKILADPEAIHLGELSRLAKVLGTTAGEIVTEFERAA